MRRMSLSLYSLRNQPRIALMNTDKCKYKRSQHNTGGGARSPSRAISFLCHYPCSSVLSWFILLKLKNLQPQQRQVIGMRAGAEQVASHLAHELAHRQMAMSFGTGKQTRIAWLLAVEGRTID